MKTPLQRVEYVRNTLIQKKPDNPTSPVTWRGKRTYFDIVQLDVDYLMFRIENTRTTRQQLEYLEKNPNLNQNFFDDPESPQVQDAQREILLDVIDKSPTGELFYDDLRARGQDEPAIVTYEGYIINGNRRTAALQRIGTRYIDCVVLPENATSKEIYELEQELQISQEFKDPYHWINELLNFYKGIHDKNLNDTEDQMAARLRINKASLKSKLRMMDLVDQFLQWKKIPGKYNYEKLDAAEEVFRQLERATPKIANASERRELAKAVYVLVENPPATGRLYAHVGYLIRNWKEVYRRVAKENGKAGGKRKTEKKPSGDDLLHKIAEADLPNNFSPVFDDHLKSEKLGKDILEAISDIRAESKDRKDSEAAYEGISAALRELQSIVIYDYSTNLKGAKSKLTEIRSKVDGLLKDVSRKIK
jgi:hypothetical protein